MAEEKSSNSAEQPKEVPVTTPDYITTTPDRSTINSPDNQPYLNPIDTICQRIVQILTPVTIGCLYTCLLVRLISPKHGLNDSLLERALRQLGIELGSDNQLTSISTIFTIVVIFCFIIVLLTLFVLLIFYMEWHRCLSYYLYVPTLITFVIITPLFVHEILRSMNWLVLDLITMTIIIWNFTILGIISIFGLARLKAPLACQQLYLIHNSSVLAVLIIQLLPSWAPWLLLVFMIVWDSFAVLAPVGPLNLILNMAEREGIVEMPGLVYSTESAATNRELAKEQQLAKLEEEQRANFKELVSEHRDSSPTSNEVARNRTPASLGPMLEDESTMSPQPVVTINSDAVPELDRSNEDLASVYSAKGAFVEQEKAKQRQSLDEANLAGAGTNIGVGDFVFYSLLVGLTAKGRDLDGFYTTVASLLAILVGLAITLVVLAITRRSLPAVPISVGMGVAVSFLTIVFVPRLSNRLAINGIFT